MPEFFAAFIMTYERPLILRETINRILSQTYPPEKILIIDNSETAETEGLVLDIVNSKVEYLKIGYNSGPAGAARMGLQKLADEGYQWIYWGDDDDPPKNDTCFEELLHSTPEEKNIGIMGAVGHAFNAKTGRVIRTSNQKIQEQEWIEVDVISGGMCMIVNSKAIAAGALPDAALFYGFEEFDFCMKVKKAGFKLLANAKLFAYYRAHSKRPIELAGKRGLRKKSESLWREYYSTRNMLFIAHKHSMHVVFIAVLLRSVLKTLYNFRFGLRYGRSNAGFIFSGIFDYFRGRMGQRKFI